MGLSPMTALLGDAPQGARRTCFLVVLAMFPVVITGSAMIWHFFNDETLAATIVLSGLSKKSVEYRTAFFVFSWLSSLVCTRSKLQGSVAWAAALVVAIFVSCFPIESLDNIRQLSHTAVMPGCCKDNKDLHVLEAGGVIA
jgi:hypothetical protein